MDSNGFRTGIIANGSAGGVTMEYGVKLPQLRRYFAVEIQDNCQKNIRMFSTVLRELALS